MKDLNNFNCTCFCCKDPELKETANSMLCTTRVGVNRIKDGEVDWFSVKLWGKSAEVFSKYVKKGSQIALSGRLHIETGSNDDKIFPTIYVEDFRFIGGNGQKKEQKESGAVDESVAVVDNLEVEGGVGDEDIPF